jgi:hypothetical protein
MITITNVDIQILKALYDYYNPANTWWREPEVHKLWDQLKESIPEFAEIMESEE